MLENTERKLSNIPVTNRAPGFSSSPFVLLIPREKKITKDWLQPNKWYLRVESQIYG